MGVLLLAGELIANLLQKGGIPVGAAVTAPGPVQAELRQAGQSEFGGDVFGIQEGKGGSARLPIGRDGARFGGRGFPW